MWVNAFQFKSDMDRFFYFLKNNWFTCHQVKNYIFTKVRKKTASYSWNPLLAATDSMSTQKYYVKILIINIYVKILIINILT